MPLLFVLAATAFVSAFSNRILDPLVPAMARDLHKEVPTIALLASAYTFPYALSQPFLGAIGDQFGKERVLKYCLAALSVALVAIVLAPNYPTLFLARAMSGIAGGGIIPVSFAIIGDRIALGERQAALARLVMASQTAILMGSAMSGLIATHMSWRTIFAIAAVISVACYVMFTRVVPEAPKRDDVSFSLAKVKAQYVGVLANPLAATILGSVALEGVTMFGIFPYVADRLETRGFGGSWEAGLIIASMSIGGIVYTLFVRHLLRYLGREGLILAGGAIAATALCGIAYSPSWHAEALFFALLGLGFFSIHNSLQLQATELAPDARASSVALFAFCFFLGQATGPVLFQFGFAAFGLHAPIAFAGLLLAALSVGLAFRLRFRAS